MIKGWAEAMTKYSKELEGDDPPYIYNERASVGFLAAGMWMNGSIAMEEYRCQKGLRGKQKKHGRADLYFHVGDLTASAEAKFIWMNAASRDLTVNNKIRKSISGAINDVALVQDAEFKMGICFYVMGFPKKRYLDFEQNANLYIKKEINRYSNYTYLHLWAWYFPKQTRYLCLPERIGSNFYLYYPGVILGMRAHK